MDMIIPRMHSTRLERTVIKNILETWSVRRVSADFNALLSSVKPYVHTRTTPPILILLEFVDLAELFVVQCKNLKPSQVDIFDALLEMHKGSPCLGNNPRSIARDVSTHIRKALEWYRNIALQPKKRETAFAGASYVEKTKILRVCDHVCREGENTVLAIADVETPASMSRAPTHALNRSSSNMSVESNELASFDSLLDEALGGCTANTVVQADMIAAPSPLLAAEIGSPEHRESVPPPPPAYFGFPGSSRVSVVANADKSRMSFDELLDDVIKDAEVPLTGGSGSIQRSLTVSAANAAKALKLKKDQEALKLKKDQDKKGKGKTIASKKAEQDKDPTTPKSKCKAISSKKAEQEKVTLAKALKLKKDPTTPKAKCKAIASKEYSPTGEVGAKKAPAIKKGGGNAADSWERKKRKCRASKAAKKESLDSGSSIGFAMKLARLAYKNCI